MRTRFRKLAAAVGPIEGRDVLQPAPQAESEAGDRLGSPRAGHRRRGRNSTEGHRDPLRLPRTGARPARAGRLTAQRRCGRVVPSEPGDCASGSRASAFPRSSESGYWLKSVRLSLIAPGVRLF
jgi:hypothetical protein